MNLPSGVTQIEFETACLKIIDVFKHKFKSDIIDTDDFGQELFIIITEILPSFEPGRGKLEHFLMKSIRNRIFNFIRNHNVRYIDKVSIEFVPNENLILDETDYYSEFIEYVDEHLPAEFRLDYLRLMSGKRLTKVQKQKLYAKMREIYESYFQDGKVEQSRAGTNQRID